MTSLSIILVFDFCSTEESQVCLLLKKLFPDRVAARDLVEQRTNCIVLIEAGLDDLCSIDYEHI